jgi:endonuclease-3
MSTKNRGDRIQLLHKVATKHFEPVSAPDDREVLEHLIYACCLEDAPYDQADEAFHRLQESYFDWNEIRVTTISELCESLSSLPDPTAAANRIKKNLQSLFESRYSFDLNDMVKMNQGKAVQELEKLSGITKFVLGYVVQNALGGHSIPVSQSIMEILLATEVVSEAEAAKGVTPGLERTIPKTKGADFASCLHQLAIAAAADPNGKTVKAILKEAGAKPKKETPPAKKAPKSAKSAKTAKKAAEPTAKAATTKKAAKKPAVKKAPTKTASAQKKPAKKSAKKTPTKRKPR